MGVVIRQSIKASIVSYIGALLGALTIIIVYPFFLEPSQIGLIRVITEGAALFSLFSLMGTNNAFVKYYPKFSKNNINGFLGFILIYAGIGFVIFCSLYLIFQPQIILYYSEKSAFITHFLYFIIPLAVLFTFITLFEIYSAQLLRIVYPKMIKEIVIRILTIILVLAFSYFALSMTTFMYITILIYLLSLVSLVIYVRSLGSISIQFNFKFISKEEFKSIIKYMLTLFVFSICISVANRADLFIISSKLSLADAGIFTIAFFIASFIDIPIRAIVQIVTPLVSKALNENDMQKLDEYYKKSTINQFLISSFIFIIIWLNIDTLYAIMPKGAIYDNGKYVVLFIGLSRIIDASTSLNSIIMTYSKYYYYSIVFVVFLAIITVINNLIFIPIWGISGSAFATFLSLVIYNFTMTYFVWRKFKLQPFTSKIIWGILTVIICIGLLLFLPTFGHMIIASIIKSVLALVLFVFLIVKLKISADFNKVFDQIKKVRNLKDIRVFLMTGQ